MRHHIHNKLVYQAFNEELEKNSAAFLGQIAKFIPKVVKVMATASKAFAPKAQRIMQPKFLEAVKAGKGATGLAGKMPVKGKHFGSITGRLKTFLEGKSGVWGAVGKRLPKEGFGKGIAPVHVQKLKEGERVYTGWKGYFNPMKYIGQSAEEFRQLGTLGGKGYLKNILNRARFSTTIQNVGGQKYIAMYPRSKFRTALGVGSMTGTLFGGMSGLSKTDVHGRPRSTAKRITSGVTEAIKWGGPLRHLTYGWYGLKFPYVVGKGLIKGTKGLAKKKKHDYY